MKSNTDVIKTAKKYLNHGGSGFRNYAGLPAGSSWCNAYVDYVAYESGVKRLYFDGKKETYCPHSIQWCKKNLAQVPLFLAMAGDIIYFDWDKNGRPNHIGLVRSRNSTDSIYTIEGNTDKKDKKGKTIAHGVVAERTRNGKYVQAVYRPHFVPAKVGKKKLKEDGHCGYYTIYNLQLALGLKPTGILTKETVKAMQQKAGATPDGAWGPATSKKAQAMIGAKKDGAFGPNSVIRLQKWINSINYPVKEKKPSQAKQEPQKKAPAKAKTLTPPEKAVAWARKIAKEGKYTYKKWNNKDKSTKLCPICHKLAKKYQGWNCIGFVSACLHHGGGIPVTCSCSGIGTDSFFTKVSLNSWRARNGKDWIMITNGGSKGGKSIDASKLKPGDVLICYDGKGVFHHVVLYAGNGKYIDCTRGKKPHIGERSYAALAKAKHVTRAFRYTGK